MIKEAIAKLVERQDLSESEMIGAMNQIMGGEATPAQIGSFITALRMKGETIPEIVGAARVMRAHATPIRVGAVVDIDRDEINVERETIIDTCGTGGSGTRSFNISTTVALAVAACGGKVAKHGNRSITSSCGSADVLEKLGVNLDIPPEQVGHCVEKIGIGFLFAPALHGAMKYAIGPRREIGIRTIFNVLGPLTNPAGADRQVLGVYKEELVEPLAKVLLRLGCRRGFVVHGSDGMDEITLTGPTLVAAISGGAIEVQTIEPQQFGFECCRLEELQGGDAEQNAAIVKAILAGEKGPKRDIVVLNGAYALLAAGLAPGVDAGIELLQKVLDNGKAQATLDALVRMTNQ
ncbi:MAG: anthranilate phosphoribosyltransferase [Desulfuromonadales bacterium]|nr:anthranilate phosphoribosyltransferase [Chloroflexota bacterium]MCK4622463.1 anthranilate phosphoribosyltransferase [Desulfuromonadales bacterium]